MIRAVALGIQLKRNKPKKEQKTTTVVAKLNVRMLNQGMWCRSTLDPIG